MGDVGVRADDYIGVLAGAFGESQSLLAAGDAEEDLGSMLQGDRDSLLLAAEALDEVIDLREDLGGAGKLSHQSVELVAVQAQEFAFVDHEGVVVGDADPHLLDHLVHLAAVVAADHDGWVGLGDVGEEGEDLPMFGGELLDVGRIEEVAVDDQVLEMGLAQDA